MKIKLKELIGERCITAEQGRTLLERIERPLLFTGRHVMIDFEGVRTLLPLFLNHSIATLLRRLNRWQLNQQLSLVNITDHQRVTFESVMEAAVAFYRPAEKKAAEEALAKLLKKGTKNEIEPMGQS